MTGFAPGDQVYGFGHGAFAEYTAVPQGSLARKPSNLTFEQAAAVPLAAITAIQGLRAGGLQAGQHVDLVFQLGGTYSPAAIRKVLTPHGTLIQSYGDGNRWVGPIGNMIKAAVLSLFVGQTLKAFNAKETTEALDEITELIEAGHLTPVIDRTYPLAEGAQAIQLVEQGRPAGKVTVTITSDQ